MREHNRAQTALAFITSDERDILELCFSAGCPPAEISRKLQIPLGAINAQLDRGLFGFLHALSVQASSARKVIFAQRRRVRRGSGEEEVLAMVSPFIRQQA